MATKTNNLGLSKAELTDAVKSTLIANNDNFDKIDDANYSLEKQTERLRANQISDTASGFEIELENDLEMESTLQISGNSEQDTRSGKNLFDSSLFSNITREGVAITRNNDGTLNFKGTATKTWFEAASNINLPVGTYIFNTSMANKTGSPRFKIWLYDAENNLVVNSTDGNKFTTTKEMKKVGLVLENMTANTSYDLQNIAIQLEEGTVATAYEPYGAKPSPEFPSEIRSVKSKSDNLFNKYGDFSFGNNERSTSLQSDGTILSKSNYSQVRSAGQLIENIQPNTDYVLSGTLVSANGSHTSNAVVEILSVPTAVVSRIYIKSTVVKPYRFTLKFNSGNNTKVWISLNGAKAAGETGYTTTIFDKIQITKGSEALPYQPYGYIPVEAKVEGKNLINLNNSVLIDNTTSSTQVNFNIVNSNKITISSVGTWTRVKCTVKGLEPNSLYTISSKISNPTGVECGLFSGTNVSGITARFTSTEKQFIAKITRDTNENGELIFEFYTNWSNTNATSTITYDEIQVEEGSTATPYVPYQTKTISLPLGDIELRSIPDGTRDTFAKVDGVWNKVEKIMPFTITEDMVTSVNLEYYVIPMGSVTRPAEAMVTYKTDVCLMTSYRQRATGENKNGLFTTGGSNTKIQFLNENITDLATAKTILAGETGIIKLATPTYTPITDPALIQALDELEQLVLHKGYNRITVTSVNGVKAYLDLTYYKSTQKELETEVARLNEEINKLKANQPKGTATGTEIVLQDSAEMESTLQISGNSEQETRSGKNIAKINETDWTLVDNAIVNKAKNSGSTIATINLKSGQTLTTKLKMISKPTASATFTFTKGSTDMGTSYSFQNIQDYNIGTIVTRNYTATEDCEVKFVQWGNANSDIYKFQLWATVDNNVLEEYEPYGAMPSPDYPSEIRSVKSKSDNLFDKNSSITTGKYLNTTGGAEVSSNYGISEYIQVEPNTQYISWGTSTTGNNPCLNFYDENKTFISAVKHSDKNPITYTTPSNCKYIRESVLVAEKDSFMIEKGSTQTIYQPYGYVPVEVKVEGKGKNLFDKSSVTSVINKRLDDNGNEVDDTNSSYTKSFTKVSANTTYTISGLEVYEMIKARIYYYTKNKIFISRSELFYGNYTFTTPSNCEYIQIQSVYYEYWGACQIEEGSTATAYAPYEYKTVQLPLGDIELRSTPDGTRDTFERVDGVWNKVEKMSKYVFTGSESGYLNTTKDSSKKRCVIEMNLDIATTTTTYEVKPMLSNIGRGISRDNTYGLVDGFAYDTTKRIIVYFEEASSFTKYTDYMQWLVSKNAYVIPLLATPTYTPITDTALIQSLDTLEQLILHKGYNRITVTSVNGVKAYLDLSYIKDINTVLNNIITKLGGL